MVRAFFLTLMALVGLSAAIFARAASAFPVYTQVGFDPGAAVITVTNPFGYPVVCQGVIQGLRSDGFVVYESFTLPYVPYGVTENATVYTSAPFFFVNATGWADCGYLY